VSQTMTDTSDMPRVHRVFRAGFSAAPGLVGGAGTAERHEMVGSFYANLLEFLHCHHHGEDELIWPLVKERCPERREVVERLESQHQAVGAFLDQARSSLSAWQSAPSVETANTLVSALDELGTQLVVHLDEEETVGLPLVSSHISPEEYGALPGHALRSFTGDKVWLVLGLIRENMTEEQKVEMLAHMPPPVVDMWTNMGQSAFTAFVSELRA
jgi:hypothetical protein